MPVREKERDSTDRDEPERERDRDIEEMCVFCFCCFPFQPRLNNICTPFPSIFKTFDISISNWPAERALKSRKGPTKIFGFPSSIFPSTTVTIWGFPIAPACLPSPPVYTLCRIVSVLISNYSATHSIWLKVGRQVASGIWFGFWVLGGLDGAVGG